MKRKQNITLAVFVAAAFGMSHDGGASLVGDEIEWTMEAVGLGLVGGSAIVGPGIEASGGGGRIEIDVSAESFDVLWDLTGVPDTSVPWIISIADLDWTNEPGRIVGVTKTAGPDSVEDISFGADFVSVKFPRLINPPAFQSFSFDIETVHGPNPVPDAGASAVLFSMGLIAVGGAALRRMRG